MKKRLLIILTLLSQPVFAQFSADVRGEYENWNSGLGGQSSGVLAGFSLGYQTSPKYYLGGGVITGSYDTDSLAKSTLNRRDLDMVAGYFIQDQTSIYLGYRQYKIDYNNNEDNSRSFTDTTHGLGIGAATFYDLAPKWTTYGRFTISALAASANYEIGGTEKGTGYSVGTELGLLLSLNRTTNLGGGIKYQSANIKYKNQADSWAHNYTRLVLSLSHGF